MSGRNTNSARGRARFFQMALGSTAEGAYSNRKTGPPQNKNPISGSEQASRMRPLLYRCSLPSFLRGGDWRVFNNFEMWYVP